MALKEMTVIDKPRFEYRGHQVDAARNFRSKETILKTIDAMALWKVRENEFFVCKVLITSNYLKLNYTPLFHYHLYSSSM